MVCVSMSLMRDRVHRSSCSTASRIRRTCGATRFRAGGRWLPGHRAGLAWPRQERTARERRSYRLTNIVADVAAIMDTLGVERAHVVGHDWGAATAWLFATLMPQRVDRLIVASVGHPSTRGKPSLDELQKGWYRLLFLFPGIETDAPEGRLVSDAHHSFRVVATCSNISRTSPSRAR